MRAILAVVCSTWWAMALADATVPKADIAGARDSALVGRYAGSFIVAYDVKDFDEIRLPLAPLKQVADKERRDLHNNLVFEPATSQTAEGRRTRLVYYLPADVSPLQAIRNYQNELIAKGGRRLFECAGVECGGDPLRSSEGGGGEQSMAMYLWPVEKIRDKSFTNGHCAQTLRISDQRYALVELPKSNAFVSVLAYVGQDDLYCKPFNNRTIIVVDVLEQKAMAQTMAVVKADEMAQAINANGRVALYGLYFDTAKTDLKTESKPTLEQIAKLLKDAPKLKLLVVGHTDNVGDYGSNMELSRRRAESVISVLAAQYKVDRARLTAVGVSFASPVAANGNEDGRAKNRRVELVPNSAQ